MYGFKVNYSINEKNGTVYARTKSELESIKEGLRGIAITSSPIETFIPESVIMSSDSYKYSHWNQLPDNTSFVFDYMESRGGKYGYTCFVGLQYYIKKYLSTKITLEDVESAKLMVDAHMGEGVFNYEGWKTIATKYSGKLPVKIRAVKEGSIIPTRNALMTIHNTGDSDVAWLPGFLETLLMKIWAPTTVSTTALINRNICEYWLNQTSENPEVINFMVHDFGSRGSNSPESAGITGFGHLVHFMGTDTFEALNVAKYFYGTPISGYSIPATEHSTMTILGKDGEFTQMGRFLEKFASSPLKACVSDSFNIYEALEFWATRKEVLEKQNARLVIRPDSGNPITMSLECVSMLYEKVGGTINSLGYKVLDKHFRVIYGDGISSPEVIGQILKNLADNGYSAENMAFGMGGGLLQKCDRDTQKFAIKCSFAIVDGEEKLVKKDPITDQGKASKEGILDLIYTKNDGYQTIKYDYNKFINKEYHENSIMVDVFENGKLLIDYSLDELRSQAIESKGKIEL